VAQNIKNHRKNSSTENKKVEELQSNPMPGQFYRDLEGPSVDKSPQCGFVAHLNGGTESSIMVGQDQLLNTCYHQENIVKQPTDSKYRMCYKAEECIKQIVAGCTTHAPLEYSNRHNKVAGYIPWTIVNIRGYRLLTSTMKGNKCHW